MKRNGLRSIRVELLAAVLGLSILICAAFYVAAMNLSQSAISEQMESSLSTVTKQGAAQVKERVQDYYSALEIIAADSLFEAASMNQNQIRVLLFKQRAAGGYLNLMFAGKDGIAFDGTGATTDVSENANYLKAMAGERWVSSPAPVEGSDQIVMTYSLPIITSAGQNEGVLMMMVDGYHLSDMISGITYAKTGYAFIIDDEGVMLAHPDREMVRTQDRTFEKAEKDPEQKGLADMMRLMLEGQTGIGEYTYKGVTKYASYAPIEGTHWSMSLTAPRAEVFEGIDRLQQVLLLAAIILALISALAALMIANRLHRPILKLTQAAEKFSTGNLDVEPNVRAKNEMGVLARSFSAIAVNMSNILRSIYTASEQVAAGSRQIADSGMHLAQGSTEQASALEELSASVEQLASQTRMNASSASEANELANTARGLAERGNEKMGNMLKAMDEIDQSSANITRIIKVIDDIAFQTNILALNAAVEAARAGEHGKGFAVVAEEVRNLAAKSAAAAKETSGLIEGSSKSVSGGSKLARETAEALEKIVSEVSRVAALVNGISVSSGEQSSGIEQINQGLLQISKVVQSISASSQQSAAASRQLTAQADALRQQVSGFTLKRADVSLEAPYTSDAPASTGSPEVPKALNAVGRPTPSASPTVPVSKKTVAEAWHRPSKTTQAKPAKAAPVIRPARDEVVPESIRSAASAVVSAAFARPTKISLGEEDKPKTSACPAKISLGEGDKPKASARPAKTPLGEGNKPKTPIRPTKISLGEEDDLSAPPARQSQVSLSDREFGKY